jgi:hypothetical protein
MPESRIPPVLKEIHQVEDEIEAIECKIQFADLTTTYPIEYAEMRTEQEQQRQQLLKCGSSLENLVITEQGEKPDKP